MTVKNILSRIEYRGGMVPDKELRGLRHGRREAPAKAPAKRPFELHPEAQELLDELEVELDHAVKCARK